VQLSGKTSLANLSCTSGEVAPVRVLFLVHRVEASGRLWLTRGATMRSVDFVNGKISGCAGFYDLLEGHQGERSWSIHDWAERIELNEGTEDDSLNQVGSALCGALIEAKTDGDWMMNFVPDGEGDKDSRVIPKSVSLLVQQAIRGAVADDDVRSWFETCATLDIQAFLPDDSGPERWELDAKAMRLLKVVETDPSVGKLFVEVGANGWSSLGILWQLGLIGAVQAAPEMTEPSVDDSKSADDLLASDDATEEFSLGGEADNLGNEDTEGGGEEPTTSKLEQPRSGRRVRTTRKDGKSRRKRRLDPRLVAIRRNPWESPDDRVESHLKEAYDVLSVVRPEFIFRLRKTSDLDKQNIDKKHREACARYHPDRYRSLNQGSQALAEGCFTAVSDAYHKLIEPEYLEALRIKLVEKETGKKVVTDKTRVRAKVDFAKSEALFKQKRYAEAYQLAQQAIEGDPERWQYHYMAYRSGYRSGSVPVDEVEKGILGLQGMTTVEKAEQIYTLGEILLREGQEGKAYKLFRQAVSLDEQNVGASRRLRLRERREQAEKKDKSKGGLFGGLFQRRKG
jgi:tetratricopeptide (TPR) repeat protein